MMTIATRALPRGVPDVAVRRAVHEAFRVARRQARGGLSVTCVSDVRMSELNRTYRGKPKTTDVLSFHPAAMPGVGEKEWGDIFISPAYVRGEARRRGIPFQEEMLRVIVHGTLHLMGYDHATEAEELRMFGLQERALARTIGDL